MKKKCFLSSWRLKAAREADESLDHSMWWVRRGHESLRRREAFHLVGEEEAGRLHRGGGMESVLGRMDRTLSQKQGKMR